MTQESPKLLEELTPTDKLRQHFLDNASATSRKKQDWTPLGKAHAIANGMPWIYGSLKDVNKPNVRVMIEHYAMELGFDSLEALKKSLDELRDQLKEQLPENDWLKYFNDT